MTSIQIQAVEVSSFAISPKPQTSCSYWHKCLLIRSVFGFFLRNAIIKAINIDMFWKIQLLLYYFYNSLVRIDQKVCNVKINWVNFFFSFSLSLGSLDKKSYTQDRNGILNIQTLLIRFDITFSAEINTF